MSKKVKVPKAAKGFGYVGVWQGDTELGSLLPARMVTLGKPSFRRAFAGEATYGFSTADREYILRGKRSFLCEITLTPVLDAAGRPITRKHK